VSEKPVRILSISSVCRTPRWLHVRNFIGLRAEHSKECLGSHGTGADFNVIRLLEHASAFRPESLQAKDQLL
jgi:hypothetical protein